MPSQQTSNKNPAQIWVMIRCGLQELEGYMNPCAWKLDNEAFLGHLTVEVRHPLLVYVQRSLTAHKRLSEVVHLPPQNGSESIYNIF
jgi:hypothetical protein